jgi:hypothetical protein
MENLVEKLRQETKELKTEYLERVKTWAANEFDHLERVNGWGVLEWCQFLGIEPRKESNAVTNSYFYPKNFHNTKASKTQFLLRRKANAAVRAGKEALVGRAIQDAEKHYDAATEKLADRVKAKGLSVEAVEVVTGRVGVNMEVTISDGAKTVRAFTIVASGEIQRPHYRYLIK